MTHSTDSMHSTGQAAVDTIAPTYTLSALDRCDSCGAQAYIHVKLDKGELFFCAHHGNKYQEKLSGIAHSWHDESSRLLQESKA